MLQTNTLISIRKAGDGLEFGVPKSQKFCKEWVAHNHYIVLKYALHSISSVCVHNLAPQLSPSPAVGLSPHDCVALHRHCYGLEAPLTWCSRKTCFEANQEDHSRGVKLGPASLLSKIRASNCDLQKEVFSFRLKRLHSEVIEGGKQRRFGY